MKKLTTLLLATGTALMVSCGGNPHEKQAEESFDKAYTELKEELHSPILDDYFTLVQAKKKAHEYNDKTNKEKLNAEKDKYSSLSKEEAQEKAMELIGNAFYEAELIDSIGKARLNKCIERLAKKEIPCKYDSKHYSSVKVSIYENPTYWPRLQVCFTVPDGINQLPVKFLDKEGNVVDSYELSTRNMKVEDGVYSTNFEFPRKHGYLNIVSLELGDPTAQTFILERRKLGPINVGMAVSQVPASIPGLYNEYKKKTETYSDMDGEWTEDYLDFMKDGVRIFRTTLSNNSIFALIVCKEAGATIKNKAGLHTGCSVKELIDNERKLTWSYYFEEYVYAETNDFMYTIPSSYLKDSSESAIGMRAMKASDFKDGAYVENISTKR